MLSAELIAQIRFLELKAKRLATDVMSGDYKSAFHGRGMEFQEVREYVPGDDVRAIDWNVTARTNVPHIKVYREEREMTVMLAVDVSPSLRGRTLQSRMKVAFELAAVIAWLAMRNNDRVGLMLFSDEIEHYSAPSKGRGHIWRLIKLLFTHHGQGRGTDIAKALEHLEKTLKRRSTCFVISDFWGAGFEDVLKRCGRRHDVTCVTVRDAKLDSLPNAGMVRFVDSETGQVRLLDSSDPLVRNAFFAAQMERRKSGGLFSRTGVDHFELQSDQSVVRPLMTYLRGHVQHRAPHHVAGEA